MTAGTADAIAPRDASVYYHAGYWNDFPAVVAEINRRVTGRTDCDYLVRFRERIGDRVFARALFLNCGVGWVDRDFLRRGIVSSGVGVDISDDLLEQARAAAAGMPLRYHHMDINSAAFPDDRYDLIVNYAAGHHIAYVDRVFRALCGRLTEDGIFVNYDYVGPHRNQYPYEQWSAVWELNNALPEHTRQSPLGYPHLPTMLYTDPTEAIHSELTMETFRRYFTVRDYRAIGGALAYPLLTFNAGLQTATDAERDATIARVLDADTRFMQDRPDLTLFAYWWGTPRHDVLADGEMLARWEREEHAREQAAASNRGLYYAPTLLQHLIYPET